VSVTLFGHWTLPVLVVAIALGVSLAYERGVRLLPAPSPAHTSPADTSAGRPSGRQRWSFRAGIAFGVLLLVSPASYWSDIVLALRMSQGVVLAYVVAPLLAVGSPGPVLAAALRGPAARGAWAAAPVGPGTSPRSAGEAPVALPVREPGARHLVRELRWLLDRPSTVTASFLVVFLVCYLPAVMDLSIRVSLVHQAQIVGLVVIGTWLWVWLVGPRRPGRHPLEPVWMAGMILALDWAVAVLMGFAPHAWYPAHAAAPSHPLPVIVDQGLAAAILWAVPLFPLGLVVFRSLSVWLAEEDDDDARLAALLVETRARMAETDRPD
jgi:cytochrome c oxidase assembly factor CtaG